MIELKIADRSLQILTNNSFVTLVGAVSGLMQQNSHWSVAKMLIDLKSYSAFKVRKTKMD